MGCFYQTRGKWKTKSGQEIDFLQYKSKDPCGQPDISKIYLHGETLKSMGYCLSNNQHLVNPFYNLVDFLIKHPTSTVAVEIFRGFFENIVESQTVKIKEINSYSKVIEGNRNGGQELEKVIEENRNGTKELGNKNRTTNKKPVYTFVRHLNDDIDIVKIEVKPINEKILFDNNLDNYLGDHDFFENSFKKRHHKVKKELKVIKMENERLIDKELECKLCDDIFQNSKELKTHVHEHHDTQNGFKDIDADESKMCPRGEGLIENVFNESKFKCKVCEETFLNKEELKTHVLDLHGAAIANTSICSQCGLMYKNEKIKIKHEKKFHGIQNYLKDIDIDKSNICPTCGVELCNRWALENHLKVNHENEFDEPKRCDLYDESCKGSACKKKFLTPYALETHMNHYHKDGPESTSSICHYCSEEFKGAKSYVNTRLKIHIEKVHLGIRHTCKECDKVFMSIKTLKKHQKHVHRQEGHYPCKECGKVFKYYSAAQEHAYVDRGETPYECKHCDFKSAHSWALAKHRPVCKFAYCETVNKSEELYTSLDYLYRAGVIRFDLSLNHCCSSSFISKSSYSDINSTSKNLRM